MEGWLTPIQKIALGLLIAGAVGGTIYLAVTTWADSNRNMITNPSYTKSIIRTVDEVMA